MIACSVSLKLVCKKWKMFQFVNVKNVLRHCFGRSQSIQVVRFSNVCQQVILPKDHNELIEALVAQRPRPGKCQICGEYHEMMTWHNMMTWHAMMT